MRLVGLRMILTDPTLDHRIYHSAPLTLDRSKRYEQAIHFKPRGLWFSVQADWDRWCSQDGCEDWVSEALIHKVVIKPFDDLLILRTPEDLDAFTLQYGRPDGIDRKYAHCNRIDWPEVAAKYPGIVSLNYVWERRLDGGCDWYYTWDAASGCVWDLDYVRCIIPIGRNLKREGWDW